HRLRVLRGGLVRHLVVGGTLARLPTWCRGGSMIQLTPPRTHTGNVQCPAPRISPRRTIVTRLFNASATASSPSASLNLSMPPKTTRLLTLTHAAKRSHAGASPVRQRSSSVCSSPGITRQAPQPDTGAGSSGVQQVASLIFSSTSTHRDLAVLAGRYHMRPLIPRGV